MSNCTECSYTGSPQAVGGHSRRCHIITEEEIKIVEDAVDAGNKMRDIVKLIDRSTGTVRGIVLRVKKSKGISVTRRRLPSKHEEAVITVNGPSMESILDLFLKRIDEARLAVQDRDLKIGKLLTQLSQLESQLAKAYQEMNDITYRAKNFQDQLQVVGSILNNPIN